MVELEPGMMSALIELGWLPRSRWNDRAAIMDAFYSFIHYALNVTRKTRR
jgi:hypothetical protein